MHHETFHDLASDYLAGLLTDGEAAAFEQRLAEASGDERAAFAALQDTAALLTLSDTPLLKAPATARDAVLSATTGEVPAVQTDIFTYLLDDEGWQPLPMPVLGAKWKPLRFHPDGSPKMFLLELPPGCEFPDHPHPGDEECLLLKGDLVNDGRSLGPGDYVKARAGTHHHGLRTVGGCVCLLILNAA